MKLVNYRCSECGKDLEALFNDSEVQVETLDEKCTECGGEFHKFNLKNNIHRVYIEDSGGLD